MLISKRAVFQHRSRFKMLGLLSSTFFIFAITQSIWNPWLEEGFGQKPAEIPDFTPGKLLGVEQIGSKFSTSQILSRAYSASLQSTNMAQFTGLMIICLLIVVGFHFHFSRIPSKSKNFALSSISTTFAALLWSASHHTLLDEAYLWIIKMQNFNATYHLGIPVADQKYAESTVGTFQFLVGALLMQIGVTGEQALFLSALFFALLGLHLMIFSLIRNQVNPTIIFLVYGVVVFSPAMRINVSYGLDNVLAFFIIILWLSMENDSKGQKSIYYIRICVAVSAPIIRADLVVLSLLLITLQIRESRSNRDQRNINHGERWLFLPIVLLSFLTWLLLKWWSFGEIVPAMIRFKTPRLDLEVFLSGVTAFGQSIGLPALVGCLILSLSLLWEKNESHPVTFGPNLIFVVLTISILVSTIFSGGDYFGPEFVRYTFPISIAWLYLVIRSSGTISRINVGRKESLSGGKLKWIAALTCILSIFSPISIKEQQNLLSPGSLMNRTVCDEIASKAVEEWFHGNGHKAPLRVMSPDNNIVHYVLGSYPVDVSGLIYKPVSEMTLNPLPNDNMFRKYQLEIEVEQIRNVDLVWLHDSASCQDYDPFGLMNLYRQNKNAEITQIVFNSDISKYRFGDIQKFIQAGLTPKLLVFDYEFDGVVRKGITVALMKH